MKRRKFGYTAIGTTFGLGTSVGYGACSLKSQYSEKVKWQMETFLSESYKGLILYDAPQIVCDLVKELTDGKFTIKLNRTVETKTGETKTEKILQKVSNGNIDCGYSGIYYASAPFRPLFFGCAIPFGLSPQEQNAWLNYKDPQDPENPLTYIQKIYQEKVGLNIIPFPAGGTGGQMGGWFTQEVDSLEKLKSSNISMRIPGLGGDILRELGVKLYSEQNGSPMTIHEIKTKLENKTIQAAEWIGPHDDFKLGLDEVANYYYYPGWWEPSTTFDVQVNKQKWEELTPQYKAIFKAACAETHNRILTEYDIKNANKLQEMLNLEANHKVKIRRFSDDILQEAKNKRDDLFGSYAEVNKNFKDVYDVWSKFKKDIRIWSEHSNYTQIYELSPEFKPYKPYDFLTNLNNCRDNNFFLP